MWSVHGRANTGLFELYGRHVVDGGIPYRPGFTFEYPPGAIPPLAVPALPHGAYVPWFHVFELACLFAAVAAVALIRPRPVPVVATAIAPAFLGQLALNSFDLWPTALAVLALAAVLRSRPALGLALLAAATAAKLYPALLAPVLLTYVAERQGRPAVRRGLIAAAVVLAAAFVPFAAIAPGGLRFSLGEQLTRGLQVESFAGSLFGAAHRLGAPVHVVVSTTPFSYDIGGRLAGAAASVTELLALGAVYATWRALRRGVVDRERTILAVTTSAVGFLAFGKVLSPQYLLLLAPFVALLDEVWPLLVLAAALGLTQVWARFPEPFGQAVALERIIWVTLLRNAILVAWFFVLLVRLRRSAAGLAEPQERQELR